jgi:hypothetical protein
MSAAVETQSGDHVKASDVKQRLILSRGDPSTLLLWPPNLFAFTSYILHLSGAYQLVVSPPPKEDNQPDLYHWPPKESLLQTLLDHFESISRKNLARAPWQLVHELKDELKFIPDGLLLINDRTSDQYNAWTYLVRKSALEWRQEFDRMENEAPEVWEGYRDGLTDQSPPLEPSRSVVAVPPLLRACWEVFCDIYYPVSDDDDHPAKDITTLLCNGAQPSTTVPRKDAWLAAVSLLTMHAIADDASVGWGILATKEMPVDFPRLDEVAELMVAYRKGGEAWENACNSLTAQERIDRKTNPRRDTHQTVRDSPAQRFAFKHLEECGTVATIGSRRARILPKRHNPDVGITLRSVSSNLAFHFSPIEVNWKRDEVSALAGKLGKLPDDGKRVVRDFTMLLLPFPMHIHTKDFVPVEEEAAHKAIDSRHKYGLFKYAPDPKRRGPVVDEIIRVIERAREEEETVDVIVLPELALNVKEYDGLMEFLTKDDRKSQDGKGVSVFIAGVSKDLHPEEGGFDRNNTVCYGYRTENGFKRWEQFKHHRWQLNKSQIEQYGLSRNLGVDTKWWEAINIERRHVSFVNIGDGITLCPLICEDLARQDPIADLIRQVGPSLVVTILMDGPQHKDRWSSRYAAILSEDPGSAVLALTSFGMVRRWSTRFGRMSRVVALWSDKEGSREIELESDALGILLTLKVESECEVIADGRLEMCPTSKIMLMDVIQVQPPSTFSKDEASANARSSSSATS